MKVYIKDVIITDGLFPAERLVNFKTYIFNEYDQIFVEHLATIIAQTCVLDIEKKLLECSVLKYENQYALISVFNCMDSEQYVVKIDQLIGKEKQ